MTVEQKLDALHNQLRELQAALDVTSTGELVLKKNLTIARGADITAAE
jgi:hypothetical protein